MRIDYVNESTPRIKKLREKLIATDPIICPERAIIWTRSYQEHEDKPPVLKAALALKNTLTNMTINIYEDELLVGNQGSSLRAAPLHPQINTWFMNELERFEKRQGSRFKISESTKNQLTETMVYWKGKTVYEHTMALLPEETKNYMDSMVYTCN